MPLPPHLILLGGFLGAGKTTALRALGEYLTGQGIRVALVTNDQGTDLVDTALLRACGHPTEEVAGGCFCCRFDELLGATRRFPPDLAPEAFVAEAVGSCTDLAATVTYPLRRLYGDAYTVAPLSVLVDAVRARQVLGLDAGTPFSPNVEYIYRKQLEEADIVVVNKRDLLDAGELDELHGALARAAPHAERFGVSLRHGQGLDPWFQRIVFGRQRDRAPMTVDYDAYADGEAQLGWLNATIDLAASPATDGNALLARLAAAMQHYLEATSAAIAHLKMTLHPGGAGAGGIASVNVVRGDVVPELGLQLTEPVGVGRIVVNARAESAPETLLDAMATAVRDTMRDHAGVELRVEHRESFRPGRPSPTHRVGA